MTFFYFRERGETESRTNQKIKCFIVRKRRRRSEYRNEIEINFYVRTSNDYIMYS